MKGTGPKGRITQEDVQAFTKAVMAAKRSTKAAAGSDRPAAARRWGCCPGQRSTSPSSARSSARTCGRIRKISGANLHRNWVMIPHVTNHDDADITELEAFRVQLNKENEKSGIKVTMLAFLIKACVAALKKFPQFNASLDGEQLVLKQYYHIGFAADTPNGLVVPVIKDADRKGMLQISQEMGELAAKAREGKLSPADMSGAGFTISSLGGIGGRYFTPIINAPEVAILGVCKSQIEPVWDGKQFQPRLMLPLSLSWDHRVIDGAAAARFNAYLGAILADFRRTMLERSVRLTNPERSNDNCCGGKKAGQIAIAADTLVTFGDTRLANRFEDNTKIFKVETDAGPSYLGMAGTVAHFPVLRKAIGSMPRETAQARQPGRGVRHLHQAASLPEGKLLPADQGRGQRPVRVQPVQRGDRQCHRHLRPVQLPRGVRVQGVLGHRLGPQLCAGRDACDLCQGEDGPRSGRSRHRRGLRIRPQLGRRRPTSSR